MATTARRKRSSGAKTSASRKFKCPDCGRTFDRPQSLGAHRRQAHGVAGESARSQSRVRAASRNASGGRPAAPTAQRSSQTRARAAAADGGAAGTSADRSGRRGNSQSVAVDRNGLLRTLFPDGIPASEEAIRGVNSWLDEAERLARLR
jgi:uncharacterized C2H2 Zn-finger protein